jgi:cell division protease FtsH
MLAQVLLEREVIYTEDVEHIFGKRAWVSRSEEILELQEKANGKKAEKAKVTEASKQEDDTIVTTSDSKAVNA